jgi:hypothetical protein
VPDGLNAASRLFGVLESASVDITFAAPLEPSMDANAAKSWNEGQAKLKHAEKDCGI